MPRKLLPFLLTTALGVTLSGVAAARQPHALAEQQTATARVLAECPRNTTSGYRDMLSRLDGPPNEQGTPLVVARIARLKLADRVVISCAGETVQTGAGYRDILKRFESDSPSSLAANSTLPASKTFARAH